MEEAQRIRMLQCPEHPVDVVIDTDTFNEVDDQFALAYLLRNPDRLRLQAIYAAPFLNEKADTPRDGMEKSYQEILKLLELSGTSEYQKRVYKGAEHFLEHDGNSVQEEQNRIAPAVSAASEDLVRRAMAHSAENPLYVIGIAAATNIASAILCEPEITERMVVVWLGGSAFHCEEMEEFNLAEDPAAAQILFDSGVPLVQLPCWGVVESFSISRPELEKYLIGKNPLADYLAGYAIEAVEEWAAGTAWAKVIWDVTAVAWLLNDGQRFMNDRLVTCPEIAGDSEDSRRISGASCFEEMNGPGSMRDSQGISCHTCPCGTDEPRPIRYVFSKERHTMRYVYRIERDALMTDLIRKLCL